MIQRQSVLSFKPDSQWFPSKHCVNTVALQTFRIQCAGKPAFCKVCSYNRERTKVCEPVCQPCWSRCSGLNVPAPRPGSSRSSLPGKDAWEHRCCCRGWPACSHSPANAFPHVVYTCIHLTITKISALCAGSRSTSLCVYVCVHIRVGAYEHMCMCVWKAEANLGSHSSGAVPHPTTLESLIGLELTKWTRLAGQPAPEISLSLLPGFGIMRYTTMPGFFSRVVEVKFR